MSADRILELEQLLVTANEAIAKLTLANTHLTSDLAYTQSRNKKLKRASRSDERKFHEQLLAARKQSA